MQIPKHSATFLAHSLETTDKSASGKTEPL